MHSSNFGPRNNLPQYVCVPNQPNQFAGTGYLSSSYAGFSLGADPASGNFKVRDLNLPGGVDDNRFTTRRRILDVVNDHFTAKEKSDSLDAVDTFYNRAYAMISSQKAREAFDINKEDGKIRDEYGRNTAGARLLLCRRLVESGVRFVTTTYGGWDMHSRTAACRTNQLGCMSWFLVCWLIWFAPANTALRKTKSCECFVLAGSPARRPDPDRTHWNV